MSVKSPGWPPSPSRISSMTKWMTRFNTYTPTHHSPPPPPPAPRSCVEWQWEEYLRANIASRRPVCLEAVLLLLVAFVVFFLPKSFKLCSSFLPQEFLQLRFPHPASQVFLEVTGRSALDHDCFSNNWSSARVWAIWNTIYTLENTVSACFQPVSNKFYGLC